MDKYTAERRPKSCRRLSVAAGSVLDDSVRSLNGNDIHSVYAVDRVTIPLHVPSRWSDMGGGGDVERIWAAMVPQRLFPGRNTSFYCPTRRLIDLGNHAVGDAGGELPRACVQPILGRGWRIGPQPEC